MRVAKASFSSAHIAVFNIARHGHVNPSLAIVRELVDRGHRVTYAISEEFAPQVEAAGATPVLYRPSRYSRPDPSLSGPKDPITGVTMSAPVPAGKWLYEAMAVLPQMQAAYNADRPDLFLYDICGYSAPVLAATWGTPIIRLSPTYVAWEDYEDQMPVFEAVKADPAGAAYYATFAAWLAVHGITASPEEFVLRPQRCIVLIPRVLQPYEAKVADTSTFVGPCYGDRSHEGSWQPPEDDRPVLLISLGSVGLDRAEFYRACITAFKNLDWHIVMAIGHHVDSRELGPVPDNFEMHRWVPQFSVLSQADAFVTHAGPAGICEALYHEVPMIAVPQAWDQLRYAARIAELGVGRHLPREQATATALHEAVLALAGDPDVAARVAKAREEMCQGGGTTAAADLIEQHLRATC